MMTSKRISIVLTLVLTLSPLSALARPVTEIVDRNSEYITRANFLSWAVEAFGVSNKNTSCVLPFARPPKGLLGTLCAAKDRGIIDVFKNGTEYTMAHRITRGDALFILTQFTGKRETKTDIGAFKDVKSDRMMLAVRNAVTYKWMTPLRADYFGVDRLLTGAQALVALQAAAGEATQSDSISVSVRYSSVPTQENLPKQDLLQSVWNILGRDFLKSDDIDPTEAAYKMIEAMMSATNDPYTTFLRPVSATNFSQQLKGEISGIGAQVEEKDGFIFVIAPLPGSPAERAGLVTGDKILEADGHVLKGIGVEAAVQFIRGTRGTTAQLKIERGNSVLSVNVVRDLISIPEIDVKWHGDIAVVQLSQFGTTTEQKIRSIFSDIAAQNPRGIVLDLRNNGGGYLSAADVVVSNFVPRSTVVAKVQSKTETRNEVTEEDATVNSATKLVVLVNRGSASASEIVAGALQDLKRATIVGEKSFGKGTVQEVLSFPGGEAVKITIAEWLTPLGRPLDGIGIKPDIVVDSEDRDVQLKRALDILR